MNEKKQVFNMYKTQKAKEEKVRSLIIHNVAERHVLMTTAHRI